MNISRIAEVYDVYNTSRNENIKRTNKAEEKRDVVGLSSGAKDYQSIKAALSKVSDIREDKVSNMKNKLQKGTYNVSSGDIADKIFSKLDILS